MNARKQKEIYKFLSVFIVLTVLGAIGPGDQEQRVHPSKRPNISGLILHVCLEYYVDLMTSLTFDALLGGDARGGNMMVAPTPGCSAAK